MDYRVLNYTLDVSTECPAKGPLKMILWAGDMVHNGVTDVERLSGYDVYLCFGFTQSLQSNIDYIYTLDKPAYICIIDVKSEEQMTRFIKQFRGRFSVIDSDYHGNTPQLDPMYYSALLQTGGIAYNVEGINSLHAPRWDYINALETFAPILPFTLNNERRYTHLMLELAKNNDLPVDMAWTSPDLKHQYYDDIRSGQESFSSRRKLLNPSHVEARTLDESMLETYWSNMSEEILTFNVGRAEIEARCSVQELFGSDRWNRFTRYLNARVEDIVQGVDDFRTYAKDDLSKVQKMLKLSVVARGFKDFKATYGFYTDTRKNAVVYGLSLSKL
jgi:hypothetical protein